MSKEQDIVDVIMDRPSFQKLLKLGHRDLIVFGAIGEVKVVNENNEVVYYYKGPYSDEFKKVE